MEETKGNRSNTVLLTVIGIATLLIAVVGATFAYFTAQLTGNEEFSTIEITAGTLGMTFAGGPSLAAENIYPRNQAWITKEFSIQADTDVNIQIPYTMALVVVNNTFSSGALTYNLTVNSDSDDNGQNLTGVTSTQVPINGVSMPLGTGHFQGPTTDTIVHRYTLRIFFPDTGVNQNEDQGKIFSAYISTAS